DSLMDRLECTGWPGSLPRSARPTARSRGSTSGWHAEGFRWARSEYPTTRTWRRCTPTRATSRSSGAPDFGREQRPRLAKRLKQHIKGLAHKGVAFAFLYSRLL